MGANSIRHAPVSTRIGHSLRTGDLGKVDANPASGYERLCMEERS